MLALRFPFALGHDEDITRAEHGALLRALEPVLDPQSGTEFHAESYGDASAIRVVWSCGGRAANQANPERMIDLLPDWEQACGLRPTLADSDVQRRARLAARWRSFGGNSLPAIMEMAEKVLGLNYETTHVVTEAERVQYWPGINPGPPGLEWSSNQAVVGIEMNEDSLSTVSFGAKREALSLELTSMLPAWMAYCIGTPGSFVAGIGVCGKTYL